MMAPSRALRLICRAGVADPLRAASSPLLVFFQSAGGIPATPTQANLIRFALLLETLGAAAGKNVCNQARYLNQNLPQRSTVFHSVKCEMADDQPFPLLVRAIAKGHAAPRRPAPEARQNRKRAKARLRCGHARQSPARLRVRMTGATNPHADNDSGRLRSEEHTSELPSQLHL